MSAGELEVQQTDLAALELRLADDFPTVCCHLELQGDRLTVLHALIVPCTHRDEGVGNAVMGAVCAWADRHQVTLALTPSECWGGDFDRLVRFYKRHRFAANLSPVLEPRTDEAMVRLPRPEGCGAHQRR